MRQDGFDLGREHHHPVDQGVVERRDADMVARQEELFASLVVDCEGELAVQPMDEFGSEVFVQVYQHFDVGRGPKRMAGIP
jgi:hypothetical protein